MVEGVKFCGVTSKPDIRKAIAAGASAIGVIVRPDSTYHLRGNNSHSVNIAHGKRLRQEQQSREPRDMEFVLVPRTAELDEIRAITDSIQPDRLQLAEASREAAPALVEALRHEYGDSLRIAQVLQVGDEAAPEDIDAFPEADIFHLDSPGRLPGGNNFPHDWSKSAAFVVRAHMHGKQVILAGGLNVDNVRAAIDTVSPDGVDAESANRRFGIYDEKVMRAFVDATL